MPTVLIRPSDTAVQANPIVAIRLPPYRSYRLPETKVMTDRMIVPGTSRKPDRKALVPSASCANIGSIVSVESRSIILMKIRMIARLNVRLRNRSKFNTGVGMLNWRLMKNSTLTIPTAIGSIDHRLRKPYTLMLLRPSMKRAKPDADRATERKSSVVRFCSSTFFIRNSAMMKVIRMNGRITQWSDRQSR